MCATSISYDGFLKGIGVVNVIALFNKHAIAINFMFGA